MRKILTIIFDGFGLRDEIEGNAIKMADMKNFNELWEEYPHSKLEASGEFVGLNEGEFGNSEVGHMTIGAGRLIKQHKTIVDEFLESKYLESDNFNKMLLNKNKKFHIMGLCSDGNVHASIDHYIKLFDILVASGITNIHFHLITDGRDTKVDVASKYLEKLELKIKEHGCGDITSLCGRYYAMDRDDNYDRTKLYYDLVVNGIGIGALDLKKTLVRSYENQITDEFIKPAITNLNNKIKDGDVVIWMNYRADRAKQIIDSLTNPNFDKFPVNKMPNLEVYSFLPIDDNIKTFNFTVPEEVTNPLGLYLEKFDITQGRVSESEKYPHVTYFFDGGYNGEINHCNKIEVPSPSVKTYDQKPEMSSVNVTKEVVKLMEEDVEFILVNYANPDMVGHTGNMESTTKACVALDVCLGKLIEVADDHFYKVILLSDHGNADVMIDEEGNMCTTHTTNKVPFIIRDKNISLKSSGDLTMVAPTILDYLDIARPKEMNETEGLIK